VVSVFRLAFSLPPSVRNPAPGSSKRLNVSTHLGVGQTFERLELDDASQLFELACRPFGGLERDDLIRATVDDVGGDLTQFLER